MTDISVQSTPFQVEKRSWLLSEHGTDPGTNPSITLDVSAFTSGTHYPDGYIKSGEPLALSAGLYVPYSDQPSEVQSVGLGAASAGTVTIGVDGETTPALAFNATKATVQAAINALSNVDAEHTVTVGGADFPGVMTFTFGGEWGDENMSALVVTPTGLTGGTVTVSDVTAGGAEAVAGSGTGKGLLLAAVKVPNLLDTTIDVGGALFVHGFVKVSKMPRDPGAAFWTDVPLIHHVA